MIIISNKYTIVPFWGNSYKYFVTYKDQYIENKDKKIYNGYGLVYPNCDKLAYGNDTKSCLNNLIKNIEEKYINSDEIIDIRQYLEEIETIKQSIDFKLDYKL